MDINLSSIALNLSSLSTTQSACLALEPKYTVKPTVPVNNAPLKPRPPAVLLVSKATLCFALIIVEKSPVKAILSESLI